MYMKNGTYKKYKTPIQLKNAVIGGVMGLSGLQFLKPEELVLSGLLIGEMCHFEKAYEHLDWFRRN